MMVVSLSLTSSNYTLYGTVRYRTVGRFPSCTLVHGLRNFENK
jgi:hypothetical protein